MGFHCRERAPTLRMMKDFDSAARALQVRTAALSLYGGAVFAVVGVLVAGVPGLVIGWLAGSLCIYVVVSVLSSGAGAAFSSLYWTSGATTPALRDYSLAEALAAKGRLDEAAEEYERCAVVWETDAEPRLRLARLLRDRLKRPEDAAHWFKKVIAMPGVDEGMTQQAARELVELCRVRLRQPERALPTLARLAEQRTASRLGDWARQQTAELRADLQTHGDDGG